MIDRMGQEFDGDQFDKKLLQLIVKYFSDYRIWVDVRNLYLLTKRRINEMQESSVGDDQIEKHGGALFDRFRPDECLAACVLRVAYPKLTMKIINNERLSKEYGSFRSFLSSKCRYFDDSEEYEDTSSNIDKGEKGNAAILEKWEDCNFLLACVRYKWFDMNYPMYLIDWEGDLTPGAWLVMEPVGYSISGGPDEVDDPFWDEEDVSNLPLEETDCQSAFKWYPDLVYKRLTANGPLLLHAMQMPEVPYMDDIELRHKKIFSSIKSDFDTEFRRSRNSLVMEKAFVDSSVCRNVQYAFNLLGPDERKRLWSEVIDELFCEYENSHIAISLIAVFDGVNVNDLKVSTEDDASDINKAIREMQKENDYLDDIKCTDNLEILLKRFKPLRDNDSDKWRKISILVLENLCAFYIIRLQRRHNKDSSKRQWLQERLLELVEERVQESEFCSNEKRNEQFENLHLHLHDNWLPGDRKPRF